MQQIQASAVLEFEEIKRINPASISNVPNRLWTEKEDKILAEAVIKENFDWHAITELLNTSCHKERTSKQCKERWKQHLNPIITKDKLTDVEENAIYQAHKQLGNKWVDIAKMVPGRSDNQIKNFFYCKLRRAIRNINIELRKEARFKKLRLSESTALKAMKNMDVSLQELIDMPVEQVGGYFMKSRNKKCIKNFMEKRLAPEPSRSPVPMLSKKVAKNGANKFSNSSSSFTPYVKKKVEDCINVEDAQQQQRSLTPLSQSPVNGTEILNPHPISYTNPYPHYMNFNMPRYIPQTANVHLAEMTCIKSL